MNPKLVAELSKGTNIQPLVSPGPNVFSAAEFAEAMQIGANTAYVRLGKLLKEGKVRGVRVKRGYKVVKAYEYIG